MASNEEERAKAAAETKANDLFGKSSRTRRSETGNASGTSTSRHLSTIKDDQDNDDQDDQGPAITKEVEALTKEAGKRPVNPTTTST